MSHQHSDSCNHGHSHPKSGVFHLLKKWPLWVAVALMMVAMVAYVMTLDESEAPVSPGYGQEQAPADSP